MTDRVMQKTQANPFKILLHDSIFRMKVKKNYTVETDGNKATCSYDSDWQKVGAITH